MENNESIVKILTNRTHFIEDSINISFKFDNKSYKQKNSDWIALYKCSNNRNLEEFIAVETDLTHSSNKHGFNSVKFYAYQLKNVKCNLEYEFIYGNAYNEIYGQSCPVRFIHKNDCTSCYPSIQKINHCSCVSQELVDSLLARISIVNDQLNDCKEQSNDVLSMNKQLMIQMNECKVFIEKNNQFLDNLFYTNEPVTNDGHRFMQSCTDNDLKMSLITSQECELQDLSNQNAGLEKVLDNFNKVKEKNDNKPANMDSDILNSTIIVKKGLVPEPSTATLAFINIDEDGA